MKQTSFQGARATTWLRLGVIIGTRKKKHQHVTQRVAFVIPSVFYRALDRKKRGTGNDVVKTLQHRPAENDVLDSFDTIVNI